MKTTVREIRSLMSPAVAGFRVNGAREMLSDEDVKDTLGLDTPIDIVKIQVYSNDDHLGRYIAVEYTFTEAKPEDPVIKGWNHNSAHEFEQKFGIKYSDVKSAILGGFPSDGQCVMDIEIDGVTYEVEWFYFGDQDVYVTRVTREEN